MTEKQRQDHILKVCGTKITKTGIGTGAFGSSSSSSNSVVRSLSVNVNTIAAYVSIPLQCLKGIWQKAEELLQLFNGMSSAPGQPESARLVLSRSGKWPHLVLPNKAGCLKCDSSDSISSLLVYVRIQ